LFLFVFGKPYFLALAQKGAKGSYGTVLMLCVLRSWLRLPSFVLSEHVLFVFMAVTSKARKAKGRRQSFGGPSAAKAQRADSVRTKQWLIKLRLMSMVNEND